MHRLAAWVIGLRSKHAVLVSFVAGAALALAFAPFDIWPVIFVSIPVFYLLLEAAPSRCQALLRSYFFGYGFFMAGTWWMANALLVDAAQFGWLVLPCVLGLTGLYAVWLVLFGALFWHFRSDNALANLTRFAVFWVVIEYAHSLGTFGFPWNLAGYVAQASSRVSQLAAITGVYGLSLLVILMALVPVIFLKPEFNARLRGRLGIAVLVLCIVVYGYGMARMPTDTSMTTTRVRVVQANISQAIKWTEEGRVEALKIHAKMSQIQTDTAPPPIVIWPESAFTFTLYPDSPWPQRLAELVPQNGVLITGVTRGDDRGAELKLWNSIVAIDKQGKVAATYDKHQLVPFGEFVPLRGILPMEKITPGGIDFSRGVGAQTLTVGDYPAFSPLVCYEVIFPDMSVDPNHRPAWILSATNDAWYGDSPGPYQHFAMSRMRAIEQGLPLVRAANSGISAVIDPYGRILRMLPLNERGIIDQALPQPLSRTLYARYGDWIAAFFMVALWGVGFLIKPQKISRRIVKK